MMSWARQRPLADKKQMLAAAFPLSAAQPGWLLARSAFVGGANRKRNHRHVPLRGAGVPGKAGNKSQESTFLAATGCIQSGRVRAEGRQGILIPCPFCQEESWTWNHVWKCVKEEARFARTAVFVAALAWLEWLKIAGKAIAVGCLLSRCGNTHIFFFPSSW